MDAFDSQMIRIGDLLETRLGIKSGDIAARLRKATRHMPRRVKGRVRMLLDAMDMAGHPKLRLMLDMPALDAAASEVADWLQSVDPAERRKDLILSILASLSFNLIAVFTLVVVVLRWRGLV